MPRWQPIMPDPPPAANGIKSLMVIQTCFYRPFPMTRPRLMYDVFSSNMKPMRAFTPPSDGLTGLLVTNTAGSVHEDSVVDRMLTLRHSGRTLMEIYDPSWPISTNVETGRTYQLLLVVTNCVG